MCTGIGICQFPTHFLVLRLLNSGASDGTLPVRIAPTPAPCRRNIGPADAEHWDVLHIQSANSFPLGRHG